IQVAVVVKGQARREVQARGNKGGDRPVRRDLADGVGERAGGVDEAVGVKRQAEGRVEPGCERGRLATPSDFVDRGAPEVRGVKVALSVEGDLARTAQPGRRKGVYHAGRVDPLDGTVAEGAD